MSALVNLDDLARWEQAHAGCTHGRSKAESLNCWKRRRPALDNVSSNPRANVAAKVADALAAFGLSWFTWGEWVDAGCYSGTRVSGHRMWRMFLKALRDYAVPHNLIEWEDEKGNTCKAVQFSTRTKIWSQIEAGLVCADCGSLFRPTAAQIGLAWWHNPVRCAGCEVTR